MIAHPLIARIVKGRELAYIYGPPGTGKTRIGVHLFRLARSLGLNPIFIATEAGSVIVVGSLEGEARVARTADDLARRAGEASLKGMYVIVDTINSYYRGEPDMYSRRLLAATLAFMRVTGGLALGQASEFSGILTSPGIGIAEKYARVVGYTSKVEEGKFMLKIVKPLERILLFKVEGGDLRWL
ncbi:MAG: hypothetical protein ACO2OZ_13390 [Acidilobaceae archaeon]